MRNLRCNAILLSNRLLVVDVDLCKGNGFRLRVLFRELFEDWADLFARSAPVCVDLEQVQYEIMRRGQRRGNSQSVITIVDELKSVRN